LNSLSDPGEGSNGIEFIVGSIGLADRHARYLLLIGMTSVVLVAATMVFNMLVDPLWMLNGNQLGRNFMTRERLAKAHLFLNRREAVDCVILGSSRATLLDAGRVDGHYCFNLAFSGGSVEAYTDYARWTAHFGGPIEQVIVGVDGYSLGPDARGPETYEFIRFLEKPPSMIEEYANLSILRASVRSALGYTMYHRAYDEEFRGIFLDDAPSYRPPEGLGTKGAQLPGGMRRHLGPFSNEASPRLERLRSVFPDSRYIGYAPPLHPSWFAQMRAQGTLDGYIDAMYAASAVFDRFYEFGIPHEFNANPDNTYDGSHYSKQVNDQIALVLNGSNTGYGLEISGLDREQYRAAFYQALDAYGQSRASEAVHAAPAE
jgi:hypothetical protein